MSEDAPRSGPDAPAANQHKTEGMPADEFQSAPGSGNLGSVEPDAASESRRSGDGGGPLGGRPSGEVLPDDGEGVKDSRD